MTEPHDSAAADIPQPPAYEPYPSTGAEPYPQEPYLQHAYAPYGPAPAPVTMPGSVRSAQVISFVAGGLGLALVALAIASGNPELGGALIFGFGPAIVLGIMAFNYGSAGNGVRTASIVFAVLFAVFGLNVGNPPSLVGLVGGIVLTILLSQRSAGAWFRRPRNPDAMR